MGAMKRVQSVLGKIASTGAPARAESNSMAELAFHRGPGIAHRGGARRTRRSGVNVQHGDDRAGAGMELSS